MTKTTTKTFMDISLKNCVTVFWVTNKVKLKDYRGNQEILMKL